VFQGHDLAARARGHRASTSGTIIPADDNKFSALNSAAWSGGLFVHKSRVHIDIPLQAYFRQRGEAASSSGRPSSRDEGSYVHYIEGCAPPRRTRRIPSFALGGGRRAIAV